MGKREREDSQRVLDGKPLKVKTFRFSDLFGMLLYPYRAWKEKKRQAELRNKMFGYDWDRPVQEVNDNTKESTDWIKDFLSEEEKNKGE